MSKNAPRAPKGCLAGACKANCSLKRVPRDPFRSNLVRFWRCWGSGRRKGGRESSTRKGAYAYRTPLLPYAYRTLTLPYAYRTPPSLTRTGPTTTPKATKFDRKFGLTGTRKTPFCARGAFLLTFYLRFAGILVILDTF